MLLLLRLLDMLPSGLEHTTYDAHERLHNLRNNEVVIMINLVDHIPSCQGLQHLHRLPAFRLHFHIKQSGGRNVMHDTQNMKVFR